MSIAPAPAQRPPAPRSLEKMIEDAWRRLPHELERTQVEATFRPPLPESVIDLLLTTPRVELRLADRVADRLNFGRPTAEDFQEVPAAQIVLAGRAAVEKAVRWTGAIRHRDRIRPLVLRGEREKISAAIGADAFAAAQACAMKAKPPTAEWTPAQLIEACRRDGPLCVATWRSVLPNQVGGWLAALAPSLTKYEIPDYPDQDAIDAAIFGAAAVLGLTPGQAHG